MDYYDLISHSIDYIERNLTSKMTLGDIAASANLSVSHLYRVFPALTGHTIGQYIRQRRLSDAAEQLKGTKSAIDIAFEYQFETQEGFIRSFKAMFGITPGEYRRNPVAIPIYRRANIVKPQKGGIIMQPQIVRKQFNLIGVECEIDLNSDFSPQLVALTDTLLKHIGEIPTQRPSPHIVNMWYSKFNGDAPCAEPVTFFFTGIEVSPFSSPTAGFIEKHLPESLYAAFTEPQRGTVGGPDGTAYRLWLPESGYILNEEIPGDLEVYPDSVHIGYDDVCEIYIPVCKRQ